MSRSNQDTINAMHAAGRPFREVAGPPRRGIGQLATSALIINKAIRDQLAIFDPATAPFFRRLVRGRDIQPWRCDAPRYLVTLPDGWTARTFGADVSAAQAWELLTEQFPQIQQHLAVRRGPGQRPWWELPPYDLAQFDQPRLVWPAGSIRPRFALTAPGQIAGPGTCHAAGSPFLLGLMMSQPVWLVLSSYAPLGQTYRLWPAQVARLPIPDASSDDQDAIAQLAHHILKTSDTRAEIERSFALRLLKDFGPPGATLGPRLEQWWTLDFAALRETITTRLGGDIPPRYRDSWAAYHTEATQHHAALSDSIALAETALNSRVATLYGIG